MAKKPFAAFLLMTAPRCLESNVACEYPRHGHFLRCLRSAKPQRYHKVKHRSLRIPCQQATMSRRILRLGPPPPVPLHGPAFRKLSSADKSKLRRIHANLGHPAPETLARHLKAAQESPDLIDAALDYQCDVCLESTYPRHQRPSKLPEPKEFNDLIGVDGFYF